MPQLSKKTNRVDNLMHEVSKVRHKSVKDGLIYIEKSVTKHVGDNNFAKVSIGITLPINATEDDFADAKATMRKSIKFVDKIIEEEVNSIFEDYL
jgi:peptidyl-tRNA hydrolase